MAEIGRMFHVVIFLRTEVLFPPEEFFHQTVTVFSSGGNSFPPGYIPPSTKKKPLNEEIPLFATAVCRLGIFVYFRQNIEKFSRL